MPLIWLAALVFLVEEFIWDTTARFMAQLGALRAIHAIEKDSGRLSQKWEGRFPAISLRAPRYHYRKVST